MVVSCQVLLCVRRRLHEANSDPGSPSQTTGHMDSFVQRHVGLELRLTL